MKRKIGIVASLVLITTLIVYHTETRNTFFDSRVYYGALQYWFRDHGMIYDWLRPGTPYGFTYPPFAGLVMAPMAFLPLVLVLLIATAATLVTTALLTWWLAGPLIRRYGRPVWFGFAIAFCLAVAFEPVRETITFGQVNTLLLALVAADLLIGLPRGRPWAGAAATLAAAALFPDQSREFWTSALWDTSRVGVLYYFSNQSERGFLARLPIDQVASKVWIAAVLATLVFWAWRVRRAPEDLMGGLALTGVLGCLISPVTWIHHCVWLLPAIVRCVGAASKRRTALGASAYLLTTSHLGWLWERAPRPPLEILGGNLYVWVSLTLLGWTPLGVPSPAPTPSKELADVGSG